MESGDQQRVLQRTEIKRVGKGYYIQRVKCVWVPETKRRRKIVTEYIGKVTADGIVPKRTKQVPMNVVTHGVA